MEDRTPGIGGTEERPDRWLVEQTLAGNSQAFTVLHRRYYSRIYRLAFFRTRSAADAEDIASETFVKAIAHLKSYRFQGESLFPWLARIASNLITDMGRRQSGMTAVSLDSGSGDAVRALIEALPGDGPDPYVLAERQETQLFVRNAILALPREQSEAVLMRYLGDVPLRDIAASLGKTEGAIKSLLHRALVNLRKELSAGAREAARFSERRQQTNAQTQSQENPSQRWTNLEIEE